MDWFCGKCNADFKTKEQVNEHIKTCKVKRKMYDIEYNVVLSTSIRAENKKQALKKFSELMDDIDIDLLSIKEYKGEKK